jgi:uncharacterized membrane protein YgcG
MKRIIIALILIIANFTILFSVYSLAQSPITENIKVDIKQVPGFTKSVYTVTQNFATNKNHGIFIALPYTVQGVKIDYQVSEISRNGESDKYQILNDMFNFRVRFGDQNTTLDKGIYNYRFVIEGKYSTENAINYPIIQSWNDSVSNLEVSLNSTPQNITSKKTFSIPTQTDKPEIPILLQYINKYIVPLISLFIAAIASVFGYFNKQNHPKSSEYPFTGSTLQAPTAIMPWEGDYLINDGAIDFKNTLIAYYLYLNNKGYITLGENSTSNKINFTINHELPNILPDSFNTIVTQSQEQSLTEIFENNEITTASQAVLRSHTTDKVKQFYTRLPDSDAWSTLMIGYAVFYAIICVAWFLFIQDWLLISSLWLWMFLALGLMFIPMSLKFIKTRERFNQEGFDHFIDAKGFYNYIQIAEKDKLDFDNNPTEGAKYYLANVPWAAQFGLLSKFNKLAQSMHIPTPTLEQVGGLQGAIYSSSFYSPPSDSGGFGGGSDGGFSGGGGSW